MLHIDIPTALSACSASSFIAARMLHMAEANDPRQREALRFCIWGFLLIGASVALSPFGSDMLALAVSQWMIAIGSLLGQLLIGRSLALLSGNGMDPRSFVVYCLAPCLAMALALTVLPPLAYGAVYLLLNAGVITFGLWRSRGLMLSRTRGVAGLLSYMLLSVIGAAWARCLLYLFYAGPPRADMLYMPDWLAAIYGIFFAAMPALIALLVLAHVNAHMQMLLAEQASTDELTGALTRRALRDRAADVLRHQRSTDADVAMLVLDLDHFKKVNDTCGHLAGDVVLTATAGLMQRQLRPEALLARYGGEEFIALVPVDGLPAARRVAERIRESIAAHRWAGASMPQQVTVSIGLTLVGPGEALDDAMARADQALYRAKQGGRNQCQVSLRAA